MVFVASQFILRPQSFHIFGALLWALTGAGQLLNKQWRWGAYFLAFAVVTFFQLGSWVFGGVAAVLAVLLSLDMYKWLRRTVTQARAQ
jgi:hypothetical protein